MNSLSFRSNTMVSRRVWAHISFFRTIVRIRDSVFFVIFDEDKTRPDNHARCDAFTRNEWNGDIPCRSSRHRDAHRERCIGSSYVELTLISPNAFFESHLNWVSFVFHVVLDRMSNLLSSQIAFHCHHISLFSNGFSEIWSQLFMQHYLPRIDFQSFFVSFCRVPFSFCWP